MNPSGAGVVTWSRQIDAYHSVVQVRLRAGGRSWGRAQDLKLAGDPSGQEPAAAIAPSGDALVVWDAQTSHGLPNTDDPELEVAEARPGHRFGRAALLAVPHLLGDTYPFVGLDRAGGALVMWSDSTHMWYVTRRPNGRRFGRPRQVGNPNTSPAAVDVQRSVYALGADGSAVVAWDFYGAVYAAYRPAGHAFGQAHELNPATAGTQGDSAPLVAIDGHGHALVGWTVDSRDYPSAHIVVSASTTGSRGATFTSPRPVVARALLGGLAMSPTGEATIVGGGRALNSAAGVAVVRSPAGAFSPPQSLGPTDEAPIYGVFSVAYDPSGDVFTAWRHLDRQALGDTHGEVYVEERPAHGRFSRKPIKIAGGPQDPKDPLVAGGSPGQATLVWPTSPRSDVFADRIASSDSHRRG